MGGKGKKGKKSKKGGKLKIKVKGKKGGKKGPYFKVEQIDYKVTMKTDQACQAALAPTVQLMMSKDLTFSSKPFKFLNTLVKHLGTMRLAKKWKKFYLPDLFSIKIKSKKGGLKIKMKGKKSLKLKLKGKKGKKAKKGGKKH